jgi:hypothetical protein
VSLGLAGSSLLALPAAAKGTGPHPHPTRRSCAAPQPHHAACDAIARTDYAEPAATAATTAPAGYGPVDLQSAYRIPTVGAGVGATIAIVDAYDLPTAESDLSTYRAQYGLSPCTTSNGCFRKVNQAGGSSPPATNPAWGEEIALDLDMASASCPNCSILLVEANSGAMTDLGQSVNTAVALGARYVTNSYGSKESSANSAYDAAYYDHPGVVITAAAGDAGYGVDYPAASRYVTAVGGTTLSPSINARGWSETVWSGTGSGCSGGDAKPSWQHDGGCPDRTVVDVAADADPQTGVAVYDSTPDNGASGWMVFGGTSASTVILAGVYAAAGTPGTNTYPASYPYSYPGGLFDVTAGSNGTCTPSYLCTGVTGYDGPTGLGTPNGTSAFTVNGDPIAFHYQALGGSFSYLGDPTGPEYPVGAGLAQNYQGGRIYWSPATGAYAVHGAILAKYLAKGGPAGILGFPTTDETGTADGIARFNQFSGTGGSAIYWTPNGGAHEVHGGIYAKWSSLGGEAGILGFPTTDETGTPDGVGRYNHFSRNASIYWTPSTGAWSVHGAIRAEWASLGWERSPLGYPVSDEYAVVGGRANAFQGGHIIWYSSTNTTRVTS